MGYGFLSVPDLKDIHLKLIKEDGVSILHPYIEYTDLKEWLMNPEDFSCLVFNDYIKCAVYFMRLFSGFDQKDLLKKYDAVDWDILVNLRHKILD